MKKIVSFLILLMVGLSSYGQTIPRPQPSAAGIGYKRLLADSTLFFPAQSGVPSGMIALKSNNINRKPSILADTTNNNFYWFNPKDSIWRRLIPDTELAGYVPYTGAVASVNLGEFRLSSRSIATDNILARSSAGGRLVSNSGTTVAEWGAGGGSNIDFHGFAGYNANRSSSYTDRSFADAGYVDSSKRFITVAGPAFSQYNNTNQPGTKLARGTVGMLGHPEMNLSFNMDYRFDPPITGNATHKFFDSTRNASWIGIGTNGWAMQHAPYKGNNSGNVWNAGGNRYLLYQDTLGQIGVNTNITINKGDSAMLYLNRRGGFRSVVGNTELVLEGGRVKGVSSPVWINPYNTGNLIVGDSTDDLSHKLQVKGRGKFTSDLLVNGVIIGRGGGSLFTNTTIGDSSFAFNVSGVSNTSIGVSSLKFNVSGTGNSALGGGSLAFNTTGSSNTGTGISSLAFNSSGGGNFGGGANSLLNNTTGFDNVGVGANSGRYIADGVTANSITNNSIFIGSDSRALANNQTNQIVIGRQAIGLGSNTTVLGNASTVTTAIRGRGLFGTTVDDGSNRLQVTGNQRITGRLGIGLNPQFGLDISGSGVEGIANITRTGLNGIGAGFVAQMGSDARTVNDAVLLNFAMQNSSSATATYGRINTTIISPTAGAHSSRMTLQPYDAGNFVNGMSIWNDGALTVNQITNNGVDRLQVNGSTISTQYKLSALNTAPSSATDTGTTGEIRITAGFIYVCVATNTWVRSALATW